MAPQAIKHAHLFRLLLPWEGEGGGSPRSAVKLLRLAEDGGQVGRQREERKPPQDTAGIEGDPRILPVVAT